MNILRNGVYLIVFCLPLYLVRFEIFSIPTTLLELMIYALFIFWLITKLRITDYGLSPFGPPAGEAGRPAVGRPVILILIGVTLATIFSNDLRVSAGIWKAWFVDPLLFFIVFINVIKNTKQIKRVFYSLFLSGVVVAIISLIYLLLGRLNPSGRLEAFFDSPNYLAMYLASAFIIGSWYCSSARLPARRGPQTRKKVVLETGGLIIAILILVIAIFFTKSYGAWLGIIGALSFGLIIYFWRLKKKKLLINILILGLIIILGISCFKIFIAPQGKTSIDARLVIWQESFQVVKNNLLLGIGPGTFDGYFSPYPEWDVPQPHNLYLAFLLQTGLIGFIGFIWLVVWFFRPKAGQPRAGGLQLVLMSLMTYILIHGLFDTTYWKNDLALIFWIIIGLMVVLRKSKDSLT